ncbi:hypothetical protein BpHYR1_031418 [Brachionus plicatilis]|uniref:Uncharacterized protein n=1 Tax=Brachionus plicatilis TaxID=10195 RepID=A0A3M7RH78_BRAPC|nr:hypothetical protein BpHYR1_031418 [Brachionus plicatilis]
MKLKIVSEESDSDDPPVQEPISKKIRPVETLTVTPQPQVKKKRGRPVGSNKQKNKNNKKHLFLSSQLLHSYERTLFLKTAEFQQKYLIVERNSKQKN